MKQLFYVSALSALFLTACTSGFKKGEDGLEYKLIADGSGKKLENGNFMQAHITQSYQEKSLDTVLSDTRDIMPQIIPFDSAQIPPASYKIIRELRKGDSLVLRILTDSAYKTGMQPMPPFMHKGGYLVTKVKMLNIFKTREEADSANAAEVKLAAPLIKKKRLADFNKEVADLQKILAADKPQIDKDSKIIEDYLAKNNLKATKGPWGTYIVMHTQGTGEKITSESIASVNYTGRVLDSTIAFDSNVNPKGEPLQVAVGQISGMISGWIDALLQMRKGDIATIYLPSSLGYGKNGRAPKIKPDDILVFDMEIVDVQSEEQMMAQAEAKQKENEVKMKAMMDSLKNAAAAKK